MDNIQNHISKLIGEGSGVEEWLDYITELKQQHVDHTHLIQVYTYAKCTLQPKQPRPPDVAYKKILVGLANLLSGVNVEQSRDVFLDAKILDVDCAVIRVYHAQFEYLQQNKMKAMQLLAEAKMEGCKPRSLLVKAYKNCKNKKATLLHNIVDPWDPKLLDATGDTQTNTMPRDHVPGDTDEKPASIPLPPPKLGDSRPKLGDSRPKLFSGPVRSVKKKNPAACTTPRANGVKRNLMGDPESTVSNRRGPTMSPFNKVPYSPLVRRNNDAFLSTDTTSLFTSSMFAPPSERNTLEVSIANRTPLASSKSKNNSASSAGEDEYGSEGSNTSTSRSSVIPSKEELHRMMMSPISFSPYSRSVDSIGQSTSSLKSRSSRSGSESHSESVAEYGSILEDRTGAGAELEKDNHRLGNIQENSSFADDENVTEGRNETDFGNKARGSEVFSPPIETTSTSPKNNVICTGTSLLDTRTENATTEQSDVELKIDKPNCTRTGKSLLGETLSETLKSNKSAVGEGERTLQDSRNDTSCTSNQHSHSSTASSSSSGSSSANPHSDTNIATPHVKNTGRGGRKPTSLRKNDSGLLTKDLSLKIDFDLSLGSKTVENNPNALLPRKVEDKLDDKENVCPQKEPDKIYQVKDHAYKKVREIGEGGSCKVLEVVSEDDKTFALKKVNLSEDSDTILSMYKNEIMFLEKMKGNKHIIKLHEWDYVGNKLFLILEKGDHDLAYLLRKKKNLSQQDIKKYWREMVEAVKTIHENGIVHADLKPANFILVGSMLKLIDFGIANGIQDNKTSATRICQMGTLNYMAPEVLDQDSCRISKSTDIWSLGCILYYMIYKKTPYSHIKNQYSRSMALSSGAEINFSGISNVLMKNCLQGCLKYKKDERLTIQQLLNHPFVSS